MQRLDGAVLEHHVFHTPIVTKRTWQIDRAATLANVAVEDADILDVHALAALRPRWRTADAVARFVETAALHRDVAHRSRADAQPHPPAAAPDVAV